jgi:uncharacterized membrane protein YfcA
MEPFQVALLFTAAFAAGVLNAIAGGGSFISFPALLFAGIPAISANATNAAALWPGSAASVGAYRRELVHQRSQLILFGVLSLVGGIVGALLLLRTNEEVFEQLIPYLLLLATVIFAASPSITRFVRRFRTEHAQGPVQRVLVYSLYLLVAVYGGFFGAGLGILTLAVLALLGFENIHEMNALKTLQAMLINGIAVVAFVIAGVIHWPSALVMIVGAILGGYGGAAVARRLSPARVRPIVVIISVALTAYFFVKNFIGA